jgi:hypothetical protein
MVCKSPQKAESLKKFQEESGEVVKAAKQLHKVRWLGLAESTEQLWLCSTSWKKLFQSESGNSSRSKEQCAKAEQLLGLMCELDFILWHAYTRDYTWVMKLVSLSMQVRIRVCVHRPDANNHPIVNRNV